jgi:hypothetical protein
MQLIILLIIKSKNSLIQKKWSDEKSVFREMRINRDVE